MSSSTDGVCNGNSGALRDDTLTTLRVVRPAFVGLCLSAPCVSVKNPEIQILL